MTQATNSYPVIDVIKSTIS